MPGKTSDHTVINTSTTTQVKTGPGVLKGIIVGDVGTAWVIDISDETTGTAADIGSITPTVTNQLNFMVGFQKGLRITTSGTTAGEIIVLWE